MSVAVNSMPSVARTPSQINAEIRRCLSVSLVPMVRSSPGLGKSEIVYQIAQKARLLVMDFRLSQSEITDLNGLPNFTEANRAEYVPFSDFPLEGDALPPMLDDEGRQLHDEEGKPMYYNGWLLFFDELNAAPKQLQAAAYKVLLERMIGRRKLHKKVWMVAAGNLETDMAVTHGMSTALQSRLIHLEMKVDKKDWMDWAIKNNVDRRILAFIEFKPTNLHKFDPNHTDRTFACPRTWWFTHLLIKDAPELSLGDDLALLAGTLSQGVATEFIQFASIFDKLPKLHEIEANPMGVVIPSEPSTRYAIAVMMVDYFTPKNAGTLLDFLGRLPVEARVLCLRLLAQQKPEMITNSAIAAEMRKLIRI